MHGEATMLLSFIEGKSKCFVVPVYQSVSSMFCVINII